MLGTAAASSAGPAGRRSKPAVSEGQLKKKVVSLYGAPADSTVVITASELLSWQRIVQASDRDRQMGATVTEEKARAAAIAQERKAKILRTDEARRANGVAKPSEDTAEEAAKGETLSRAQVKLDEELDEVKHMNKVCVHPPPLINRTHAIYPTTQIMLYTKCVTIRDAQIAEKSAIRAEHAEEEARLDMAMEKERLKALKMYEEREQKRIENRRMGAAVIRAQIEEREQERLRRLELKQQEQVPSPPVTPRHPPPPPRVHSISLLSQPQQVLYRTHTPTHTHTHTSRALLPPQEAMLRHIERMKADDAQEALKKKSAAKRLMEDVALANAEQIRLKNRQREIEQVHLCYTRP